MTKKICKNLRCLKIIIENWEKWLEENPKDKFIECCYCGEIEEIR